MEWFNVFLREFEFIGGLESSHERFDFLDSFSIKIFVVASLPSSFEVVHKVNDRFLF